MHRKYRPRTPSATQNQILPEGTEPRNSEITGTSTTYIAVMKPALAVVVIPIPYCWVVDARKSATPQSRPPARKRFVCSLPFGSAEGIPFRRRIRSAAARTGRSAATAIQLRNA